MPPAPVSRPRLAQADLRAAARDAGVEHADALVAAVKGMWRNLLSGRQGTAVYTALVVLGFAIGRSLHVTEDPPTKSGEAGAISWMFELGAACLSAGTGFVVAYLAVYVCLEIVGCGRPNDSDHPTAGLPVHTPLPMIGLPVVLLGSFIYSVVFPPVDYYSQFVVAGYEGATMMLVVWYGLGAPPEQPEQQRARAKASTPKESR